MPIFSQYTHDIGDAPLGCTVKDWVNAHPYTYWTRGGGDPNPLGPIPDWHSRPQRVIFRGSATGWGITPETNVRLRALQLAIHAPDTLDIKLVSLNERLKYNQYGEVHWMRRHELMLAMRVCVGKQFRMPLHQQAQRGRYMLNLDGNVGASRIGELLWFGVLILPDSPLAQAGFVRRLQPWKHYIPVKADLSNLLARVQWMRENDRRVYDIAVQGHEFARDQLSARALRSLLRYTFRGVPRPNTDAFMHILSHIWTNTRAAVYVLASQERVLLFAPFCNDRFPQPLPGEPAVDASGVTLAPGYSWEELFAREPECIRDSTKWWRNAGLVCNVPHPQAWGDSMLPELHHMVCAGLDLPVPKDLVFSNKRARDAALARMPNHRYHHLYTSDDIEQLIEKRQEYVDAHDATTLTEFFLNKRDCPVGYM